MSYYGFCAVIFLGCEGKDEDVNVLLTVCAPMGQEIDVDSNLFLCFIGLVGPESLLGLDSFLASQWYF